MVNIKDILPDRKNKDIIKYIECVYNDKPIKPKTEYIGAFIDVGLRNFCIRFSKFTDNKVIKTIFQNNFHYNNETEAGDLSDLSKTLYDLKDILSKCDFVIIEGQIRGKAEKNVRVMYYIIGAIQSLASEALIYELKPQSKTQLLGAPNGMVGKEHKDWCYFMSKRILTCNIYGDDTPRALIDDEKSFFNKDLTLLDLIEGLKKTGVNKRDDHGDVICYCYLFWIKILPACIEFQKIKPILDREKELKKAALEEEKKKIRSEKAAQRRKIAKQAKEDAKV